MGLSLSIASSVPRLPFGPPGGRRLKHPAQPIGGEAAFREGGRFRYWLLRRWMPSEPVVLWLTLHPFTATAQVDDAEIRRITAWSYRWGFGGLLVAHLYPLCAANPAQLTAWRARARPRDKGVAPAADDWDHVIYAAREAASMAHRLRCRTRVAAWGRLDEAGRQDLDTWCEWFGAKPPALCLGISASGDPLHPSARGASRPPDDAELVPFRYPVGINGRW